LWRRPRPKLDCGAKERRRRRLTVHVTQIGENETQRNASGEEGGGIPRRDWRIILKCK
jgi:hypothetical protein